jgi:sulfhydrogenase subunit gamma (sulfur reductase)
LEREDSRTLVVRACRRQARNIRAFDVLPDDGAGAVGAHGVGFAPGQVALLQAGDLRPAYFAFASAPEDRELEFLVKRTADPASQAIYEMKPGGRLRLKGVVGRGFPLDEQRGRDLVFVAMGTGVAPLRSALRHVTGRRQDFGHIVVLYGARTPEDFCYTDEADAWEDAGIELRRVISRPDGHDWSGPTGYVQSLLDHVLPDLKAPVSLVCGSREMIEQTRARLSEMGFAPEAILTNY